MQALAGTAMSLVSAHANTISVGTSIMSLFPSSLLSHAWFCAPSSSEKITEEISRLLVISCDVEEVCTTVPLSCVRGGNTTMSGKTAVRELR